MARRSASLTKMVYTHTHILSLLLQILRKKLSRIFRKCTTDHFVEQNDVIFLYPYLFFSLNHKHYTFPAIKYPSIISSPPLLPPPRGCHSGLSGWKSYLGQRHQGCPAGPSCMVSGQQSHSLWYRDWGGPHLRQPRLLQCEKNAVLNVYQPVHYTG